MKARLTIEGVQDKIVTVYLPLPYCQGDGVVGELTPTDKLEGFEAILSLPDGVGFLNSIRPSDSGFRVVIKDKE